MRSRYGKRMLCVEWQWSEIDEVKKCFSFYKYHWIKLLIRNKHKFQWINTRYLNSSIVLNETYYDPH